LGAGAFAQEEEDLEVEMFFAPAETVTSTVQHAQPLEQSPSAVTVLTREDIQASGARSIPELLRLVPNMDIYMVKPLWYAIGARGVTTIVSDSALLLVNGRDVTIDFFGSPFSTVQHFSMDDVERVEVIRGPGSALYGANAYPSCPRVSASGWGPWPWLLRPATSTKTCGPQKIKPAGRFCGDD
jgi:iron complex outermembrane receptor protein